MRVQQLPWTAAHEKLLTAFAGDALPDLCQLGNTWLPEFTALGALEPLDARVGGVGIARDDYFAGIWDTNDARRRRSLFGLPWYVDTRLLFYRSDLLARAGFATPPRDWAEWPPRCARAAKRSGGRTYGVLLPLNESEPLLALALQQGAVAARRRHARRFSQPPFRRALASTSSIFREGLAPAMTNTQISNVWDEFARGLFAFYVIGPVEHRRVQAAPAARAPGRLGDGAAAGPGRAGRLDRRRLEPRHLPRTRAARRRRGS